ncbi:unnamed protein product [Diamesa hyperborea]
MFANKNSGGLTKEQLNSLGVTGKDIPQATSTPLFPHLISKPVDLEPNPAREYKIVWKEDFRSYIHEVHENSELNLKDDTYSTKISNAIEKEQKKKMKFNFAWNLMPVELRPHSKRKAASKILKPNKKKKALPLEIVDNKMKILEQKEKEGKDGDGSAKEDNSDSEAEKEDEENDLEDDMDYGNNYFDNGEGDEEDDNLDEGDGPVY